jgi:hypothetical protein
VWGVTLSGPLSVVGMVRRDRTIYLMDRSPLPQRLSFSPTVLKGGSLCGISSPFEPLSRAAGQVSYVLLTRAPLTNCLIRSTCMC